MSQTKPPAYVALIARRLHDAHDAQVEASLSSLMESDPDCPIPYVLAEACVACGRPSPVEFCVRPDCLTYGRAR